MRALTTTTFTTATTANTPPTTHAHTHTNTHTNTHTHTHTCSSGVGEEAQSFSEITVAVRNQCDFPKHLAVRCPRLEHVRIVHLNTETGGERACVCVCVCVCARALVSERERERTNAKRSEIATRTSRASRQRL